MRLEAGAAADFIVIDHDRPDRDAILPVGQLVLLFVRSNMSHVIASVVAGRGIMKVGIVTAPICTPRQRSCASCIVRNCHDI
jgi:cytosine/adenosine deaminase-related metal-dependent hydrolase